MHSRDDLGIAVKATYCEVDGVGYPMEKCPLTDNGTKKSAKGILYVVKDERGDLELIESETYNPDLEKRNLLTEDTLHNYNLDFNKVRKYAWDQLFDK